MRLTGVLKRAVSAFSSETAPLRTFSGIQPTGSLHLGNYFGAVQQWVDDIKSVKSAQEKDQRVFSIVDMHAITLPQDPKELRENTLNMAATLIGCGLDADKAILFQQSTVHQHAELCWILGCLFTVPNLKRLSQYKDKSRNLREVPLGLFVYPVLQAADILLYKATRVPVGEDNLQNVEVTRQIARNFNSRFKKQVFPIPQSVLVTEESSRRIRSLRNPDKKMSKSDPDGKSCIYVTDSADLIRLKIKKSVTDLRSEVTYDPIERPGVSNLVCIHSQITGKEPSVICEEIKGIDTGAYKAILADVIVEYFSPMQKHISYLMANKDHLESILQKGTESASRIATETLDEVKRTIGFTTGVE